MARMTGGAAMMESVIAHGIDTVCGLPGVQTYEYWDALHRAGDRVAVYSTRHEQGAAYMAYGYAQSTGNIGTYTVVPGPGVLNTTAALCTAYGSNAPVLCVTGQVPLAYIGGGHDELHEISDQLGILRGLTKWAERVEQPAAAPGLVAEAFRQLRSGRSRPVALEMPWDVCGISAEVTSVEPLEPYPTPEADPAQIQRAAVAISKAKRPMILVGGGAIAAREEVLALAEMLKAPVTSNRAGRGIVSSDHELGMLYTAAYKLWSETDAVITIGSRMELQYLRWRCMPKDAPLIRIDIDPKEMLRIRPDVGIVADAKQATGALIEALSKQIGKRPSRRNEITNAKSAAAKEVEQLQPQMSYLNVMRDVLPRDGIFVDEITQVGFAAWSSYPTYEPRTYVTSGHQGTLGFGYPTALGAKVGNPDKPVLSIAGDGGFMFASNELATAAQYNIPLVTVVFNNNAYLNVLRDQERLFNGRTVGSRLRNPDFVKFAESFGVSAYKADSATALRPVLEKAFAADAPVLIEVPVETGSETAPWEFIMPPPPDDLRV